MLASSRPVATTSGPETLTIFPIGYTFLSSAQTPFRFIRLNAGYPLHFAAPPLQTEPTSSGFDLGLN
jgi:hypothetical protein